MLKDFYKNSREDVAALSKEIVEGCEISVNPEKIEYTHANGKNYIAHNVLVYFPGGEVHHVVFSVKLIDKLIGHKCIEKI